MGLTYVELSVACCNLPEKTSECAVICCLFQKNGGSWNKLNQTEVVHKSNNPRVSYSESRIAYVTFRPGTKPPCPPGRRTADAETVRTACTKSEATIVAILLYSQFLIFIAVC